jgi:hypothetical protein
MIQFIRCAHIMIVLSLIMIRLSLVPILCLNLLHEIWGLDSLYFDICHDWIIVIIKRAAFIWVFPPLNFHFRLILLDWWGLPKLCLRCCYSLQWDTILIRLWNLRPNFRRCGQWHIRNWSLWGWRLFLLLDHHVRRLEIQSFLNFTAWNLINRLFLKSLASYKLQLLKFVVTSFILDKNLRWNIWSRFR